jgi:hypothetical protein
VFVRLISSCMNMIFIIIFQLNPFVADSKACGLKSRRARDWVKMRNCEEN